MYSRVCIFHPQWTSRDYRDVGSGELIIPCILTYTHPANVPLDMDKACAEIREMTVEKMLEEERRKGRRGVIEAGIIGIISLLTYFATWRRSQVPRNNASSGR
jgi:hypothetical protein